MVWSLTLPWRVMDMTDAWFKVAPWGVEAFDLGRGFRRCLFAGGPIAGFDRCPDRIADGDLRRPWLLLVAAGVLLQSALAAISLRRVHRGVLAGAAVLSIAAITIGLRQAVLLDSPLAYSAWGFWLDGPGLALLVWRPALKARTRGGGQSPR